MRKPRRGARLPLSDPRELTKAMLQASTEDEIINSVADAVAADDGRESKRPPPEELAVWTREGASPADRQAIWCGVKKEDEEVVPHTVPKPSPGSAIMWQGGRTVVLRPGAKVILHTGPPRVLMTEDGSPLETIMTLIAVDAASPEAGPLPIPMVHASWREAAERARDIDGPMPRHPLENLIRAWQKHRPQGLARRHLIATAECKPPTGRTPLILARTPGVLALASAALEVVEVDGVPFATRQPGGLARWRYKPMQPRQGDMFGAPKTLDGRATAGVLFEGLARLYTGDERNPLRADLIRLGRIAYALTGPTIFTEAEGAILVGGADTKANRARWWTAMRAGHSMTVTLDPRTRRWVKVLDVAPDLKGDSWFGPPRWWLEGSGPTAYRLTGGLFRPALAGGGRRGPRIGHLGTVHRTVAGIEGALAWGPSTGKAEAGRIPDNLRPVRRGGPGPEVFIPAWQVLRLAGEAVRPDAFGPTERQRYKRRCADLKTAGYFLPPGERGTAPAGDTIEIVRQVRGSRARPAGLVVRATARYSAAYASGSHVRIPAIWLIKMP